MKLRRVISGGQTGADRAGLEVARHLGLETGGTAPKGYRTERGRDPQLKEFGLVESPHWQYQPRTRDNVRDAELTVWFGNLGSPGYHCTRNACKAQRKPFNENPSAKDMLEFAETYETINVAGNRESTNPAVIQMVWNAFAGLGEGE